MHKKQIFLKSVLVTFLCLIFMNLWAAQPMWTFTPQTPTAIIVAKNSNTQVIYTIRNQSSQAKTLLIKSVPGISQSAPCQVIPKGSCTLTLNVNGAILQGDYMGGPVLCQQGNSLQCEQPDSANILRILLVDQLPSQQFIVTPSAGTNGTISPATPQLVNAGSSLAFTATPDSGSAVNQWLLDGNVVQYGGNSYQLNNIYTNHTVEVTFNETTLSPLTQNLTLSINSPGSDPALTGTPRLIRIENTGSVAANNLQVNASGLPAGTVISSNTCTGTLNPGSTCDITLTPGSVAITDSGNASCTTVPGRQPVPALVSVSADNASSADIDVLVLGYGCIYQGGFLFSVDDSTSNTQSIGGKVAALTDEGSSLQWSIIVPDDTAAESLTDGLANTNILATPLGQYPAAQACLSKNDQGFTDWYLPAICELARGTNSGGDQPNCGTTNPNLSSSLAVSNLGLFVPTVYWGSTEFLSNPTIRGWAAVPTSNTIGTNPKTVDRRVRCIRIFTP